MMHRFVALVSTSQSSETFDALAKRVGSKLKDWPLALDSGLARVWRLAAPPTRLGHRQTGPNGCLVGLDFSASGENEADSAAVMEPALLLKHRWGAYVAIHVDQTRRAVSIFRDPTGRIECWRMPLDGAEIIFSHYEDVFWLKHSGKDINWDYIRYHLHNNWNRGTETGLHGVMEILPGEKIDYHGGQSTSEMMWSPTKISNNRFTNIDDAKLEIRRATVESVRLWSRRYEHIALDLSGGLDSAIVLGILRQEADHKNVVGINYVIPHIEGDERRFARDAARLHSVHLIEQDVSASTIGTGPSALRRLMRPGIRMMPLGYDEVGIALAKRMSFDAFFTGTGGDHLFYDHLGVNAACDYRRDGGSIFGLLNMAHELALVSRNTVWNALSTVAHDAFSAPPRLETLLESPNPYLADAALDQADYERFAHPWLKAAIGNSSPAKLIQIMSLSELQRHYYRYGRADVSEEVHPLFSQPLTEACLRVPAYWFGYGGIQRGLARSIFSDLLPPSIRYRRSKSGNTSHWIQVIHKNLPAMKSLLLDGHLASHGLIDRRAVEAALTPLAVAANQAFAPLANCLTTEMWLQQALDDSCKPGTIGAISA